MSDVTAKVKLLFEGAERGVVAAAAKSSAAIKHLTDDNDRMGRSADRAAAGLLTVGKGMAVLGAANGAIQVVGGVAGALTQLAPAALLLPGALLAGGAAMGTFKLATAGMGDALKAGLSGDMEKFAEATKGMDPAMQSAAKAVTAFKPQIDALRKTVQNEFWQDFSGEITAIGNTYLPIMQTGLTRISGSLSKVAFGAAAAVKSPFFREDVTQILDNTAEAVDNASSSVGDLLRGFVGLGGVGSTYLPKLGSAIAKVADRFQQWVDTGVENGSIKRMIDGAIRGFGDLAGIVKNVGSILGSVFTGLGGQVASPLARIRELTGQVAEFLKTAAAQDGLRALGETLRVVGEVVGRVVMTALKELAPTLVKLAPVAQEVARTLGDLLVGALETLGPIIRGVATVFNAFPGSAGLATVAVVGFVAAVKTLKAVNAVTDLLGIGNGILGIGNKAKDAEGKVGGFGTKLGGLKGAGVAAALFIIAAAADQVKVAAAGGAENLHGFEKAIHGIVTGDALTFGSGVKEQVDIMVDAFNTAQSPIGQFFRWLSGQKPSPIKVDIDPTTGQVHTNEFVGGVSRQRAAVQIDGNVDPVTGKITQAVKLADGSTGVITVDGEASPVNGKINSSIRFADGSTGTIKIDGDHRSADGKINATVTYGNGQTTTVQVKAATGQALHDIAALTQTRYMTIEAIVRTRALPPGHSAAGGAVIGGKVAQRFDIGGGVTGPGSGTSDSVPAMLSNGEWVMTADQVRNAGGFAGMRRLSGALNGGGSMRASAKAAMRTAPAASSSSGGVGRFELVAGPGADSAAAAFIAGLVRTGKLQLQPKAA